MDVSQLHKQVALTSQTKTFVDNSLSSEPFATFLFAMSYYSVPLEAPQDRCPKQRFQGILTDLLDVAVG